MINQNTGVTTQAYMEYLGIDDSRLLNEFQISEHTYNNARAIHMPYLDNFNNPIQVKVRTSLDKNQQRFAWKGGYKKPMLYGLHRLNKNIALAQTNGEGFVIFVEGESDTQVGVYNKLSIFGVSGNIGFQDDMLTPIPPNAFETYYILKEKKGGDKFVESFKDSRISNQCLVFELDGHDDLRDLWLATKSEEKFQESLLSAFKKATPLSATKEDDLFAEETTTTATVAEPTKVESVEIVEEVEPPSTPKEYNEDHEVYDGLLGEIAKKITPTQEADIMGIFAHLLVYGGYVMGRKPHINMSSTDLEIKMYANQFIMLVGNSSSGRKGSSKNTVASFFNMIDSSIKDEVYSNFGSGQGLVKKLSRPTDEEDPRFLWEYPRALLIEEEFENTLGIKNTTGNNLGFILQKAYDLAPIDRIIVTETDIRADDYWFSFMAHVTPQQLMSIFDTKSKSNQGDINRGFFNRFIYLMTRKARHIVEPSTINWNSNNRDLIRAFKAQVAWGKEVEQVQLSEEAKFQYSKFKEYVNPIRADYSYKETDIDIMLARFDKHCLSIALIFYLYDERRHDQIQEQHIQQAIHLLGQVSDNIHYLFKTTTGSKETDKLFNWITNYMSANEIEEVSVAQINLDYCKQGIKKMKLCKEYLERLVKDGHLTEEFVKTKTKPRKVYRRRS